MNNTPQHRFQPGGGAIERANVTAVLGPTNTGKTHLAVERMLGHASGMIGLPLRLLAREIYDRVVRLRGPACVALITGEEKIIPPRPVYYVCTVESMPLAIEVEFLAVDEIQLCADGERGHIFTDRLLHARGSRETMFMGSQIMAPLIRQLLPHASFITRPRFSNLGYAGSHKLSRIPRRSAIVAFSAEEVYGIAELIRRSRGGAAVVMGALSPRTRNAQVALYQSGEVDFLVATDAIGMGLNMDVDHVAFASLSKFDGAQRRNLRPIEISQIAGRAGRYLNDGTFGVTGEAPAMDDALIARIENHRFDPLLRIKWRNDALDFGSAARLFASLEAPPPLPGLGRTREAADVVALRRLLADADIAHISRKPGQLKRLWNICQVPDFRKSGPEVHAQLLGRLYLHLVSEAGVLPHDEVARQVERLEGTDGDIDTLSTRIAHVRTWTYIANRNDWLIDAAYWRGRTRAIEDRLSDALHERLTQRFIDRRTSVLMKRLHQKEKLLATLTSTGEVLIEGEFAGRLDGFCFKVDASADGVHLRTLRNAATQALQSEIEARAFRLERHARIDDGKIIVIGEDGVIRWEGMAVARLIGGHDMLSPQLELLADSELLQGQAEISVREALAGWLARHIAKVMEPLLSLHASPELQGLSKGLAFQLFEQMGVLERAKVGGLVKGIEQAERGKLRALGVRFGERHIFMPAMLKPGPMALKLKLWRAANGITQQLPVPGAGLSSAPADATAPAGFYAIAGFEVCGPRAIRIDMLERLLAQLRLKNSAQGFQLMPALWSPVGCNVTDFEGVMRALGYAPVAAAPVTAAPVEQTVQETPGAESGDAPADMPVAAAAPEPLAVAPSPQPSPIGGEGEEAGDGTVAGPATSGDVAPEAAPEIPPAPPVLWKLQQRHSARIRRAKPADAVAKPAARERKPDKPKKPRNTVSIPLADKPARAPRPPRPAAKPSLNIPLAASPRQAVRPGGEPRRNKPAPAPLQLTAKPPKQAERAFDPDSPFAKLLALKERMQKSS